MKRQMRPPLLCLGLGSQTRMRIRILSWNLLEHNKQLSLGTKTSGNRHSGPEIISGFSHFHPTACVLVCVCLCLSISNEIETLAPRKPFCGWRKLGTNRMMTLPLVALLTVAKLESCYLAFCMRTKLPEHVYTPISAE